MEGEAAELLNQALRLSAPARAALADTLLASLDTGVDEGAEEAWRSEILVRAREVDSGAVQAIAW